MKLEIQYNYANFTLLHYFIYKINVAFIEFPSKDFYIIILKTSKVKNRK